MMKQAQDLFPKNIKRKSMCEEKSKPSLVSASTASSRTNPSEASKQNEINSGPGEVFPTETSSLAHDLNKFFTEKLELPIPGSSDLSKTQSELKLTYQCSSQQEKLSLPEQRENYKQSTVIPDSLCQKAQDSPDDQIIMSSESSPSPPGSGSPQLDQLLSDLKEMKLNFRPETLEPQLLESSDDDDKTFDDLSPDDRYPTEDNVIFRLSGSSVMQLADNTNYKYAIVPESAHFQESNQDESEVISVPHNQTKSPDKGVASSFCSCKDGPVSSTESLSIPESPQTLFKVMEPSLNSSFPLDIIQSSGHDENATEKVNSTPFPKEVADSQSPMSEEHLDNVHEEDSTTDLLQSEKELETAISSDDLRSLTENILTQSIQNQLPHSLESTCVETSQSDNFSSQSVSDFTPETVISAIHFSFEELFPYPAPGISEISSADNGPKTSGQHSGNSLTSVDSDFFVSQNISVKPKNEMTSSTFDEVHSIPPGYTETSSNTTVYTHMPTEYKKVVISGIDCTPCEYSDPEPYFDCKQAASDFSETEHEELDTWTRSSGDQPQEYLSYPSLLEHLNQSVLLSSESEDYEDAPFVLEPLYNVLEENEELLQCSEASDEEFTFCEASQVPPVCKIGSYDDTDQSLTREITAELGSLSESSDEEFLTTRIVRRRVVIQADEMPDLPAQSVTEEKYKDENGHIVVKKVTRKIIRKCVSADGVEREEVSLEGAPQGFISMAEGDGYSKVVKRTVLKSEGDHTEVTFTECEGFSESRQMAAEGCKVSHVERTTLLDGERTMTHQGNPSLASDLPTAQDDFKQALGYISGFRGTELPHVVERETVQEDGTVVRRAHMRRGRTLRRTVLKGDGQPKQVVLEQEDNPRKGSKPHALKQHLHQLFHRYYKEKEDNDEEGEAEEE